LFKLHPKLNEDCIQLGDFKLSRLLLMNDANYPWFILVPRVSKVTEIHHLSKFDQQQLMVESSMLSEIMMAQFDAEKLNIAALGNIVPQLHLHHIARYQNDAAWPDPVWGKHPSIPYLKEELEIVCSRLVSALATDFKLINF